MRILITNDDGIHAPGLDACEKIARALVRRCLDRGAGKRPVRRVAFAVAQRSAAPARSRRAAFRGQGHADRLRHHGRAPSHAGDARSGAVRRQSRPQRRRGRHLFRHRRRRHGRHRARHSVVRAVAGLCLLHPHTPHWETAIKFAPDLIRRVLKAGMPRDVLVNVNFPDCPPEEVAGVADRRAGQARPGTVAHRRAPRRARQSVLLDRLRPRRHRRRARTAAISPRSTTSASR